MNDRTKKTPPPPSTLLEYISMGYYYVGCKKIEQKLSKKHVAYSECSRLEVTRSSKIRVIENVVLR